MPFIDTEEVVMCETYDVFVYVVALYCNISLCTTQQV